MIIRSQDKKRIVNFDQCGKLNVYGRFNYTLADEPNEWTVESQTALLGKYTSEEKAIKSLSGICEAYRMFGDKNKVIDMLQDDEVEV
jgi:hypothetical protein